MKKRRKPAYTTRKNLVKALRFRAGPKNEALIDKYYDGMTNSSLYDELHMAADYIVELRNHITTLEADLEAVGGLS